MAQSIQKIFSDGCAPVSAFVTKRYVAPSNKVTEGETEMDKICQILAKVEEVTQRLDRFDSMLTESISEQKSIRNDIAILFKQLSSKKDKFENKL